MRWSISYTRYQQQADWSLPHVASASLLSPSLLFPWDYTSLESGSSSAFPLGSGLSQPRLQEHLLQLQCILTRVFAWPLRPASTIFSRKLVIVARADLKTCVCHNCHSCWKLFYCLYFFLMHKQKRKKERKKNSPGGWVVRVGVEALTCHWESPSF